MSRTIKRTRSKSSAPGWRRLVFCLLRGVWILNGRPDWVSGVKFECSDFLQNLDAARDAFIEFEERIHRFIKGYLISDDVWKDAKKHVEQMKLDEILRLSSPMFDGLVPNLVLVADVM